ncbi:imidazole glycerol phosphate synthase subunit HisH [Fervidobacterium sp.]
MKAKELRIGIIAVGPGNIMNLYRGVRRAVEIGKFSALIDLVYEPANELYDILFLPGVGHFEEGMRRIRDSRLDKYVQMHASNQKLIIGVCLGMQLLFERSEEANGNAGLGLLKGEVVRLSSKRLPHVGWNLVDFKNDFPRGFYYFVHSYRVSCKDELVLGTTEYDGEIFPSAVMRDNIVGFQFHPEKSSEIGTKLLQEVIRCLLFRQ